jgi:hypothetical protein
MQTGERPLACTIKIILSLVAGVFTACSAAAYDRVVSIGESPHSAVTDASGSHGMLVDLVRALDKATNTSTEVVLRPFARSLKETADGHADFHIPFIQDDDAPAPAGLAYVEEVDFGQVHFVIYSRKQLPFDANTVASARLVEVEPGHEAFYPFAVSVTYCVPCSLDKILRGRIDALIVPSEVVDPLLSQPKYKAIHRALFKSYPVRALIPVKADSAAIRRYLIDGVTRLKETGELWRITRHDLPYSDWQP